MARPRGRPKRGIGPALGRKHFRKGHGQAKICKVAIFQFSHLFPCGQAKTASETVSTQMRAETSKAQAALPTAAADSAHCIEHPVQVRVRHIMHSCQGHFECKTSHRSELSRTELTCWLQLCHSSTQTSSCHGTSLRHRSFEANSQQKRSKDSRNVSFPTR